MTAFAVSSSLPSTAFAEGFFDGQHVSVIGAGLRIIAATAFAVLALANWWIGGWVLLRILVSSEQHFPGTIRVRDALLSFFPFLSQLVRS